jgi:F420-non-reducing hydrogenase iron-sulfur subunit
MLARIPPGNPIWIIQPIHIFCRLCVLVCFRRNFSCEPLSGTDSPYKVEANGTAKLINQTYELMKTRGIDIRRLRLAAICTVCVKPFIKEVNQMNNLLKGIGFIKDELATQARAA